MSVFLCNFGSGKPEILTSKVTFNLEGQGQSLYKTIKILTKVFCTSVPSLNELLYGQT